MRFIKEAYFQQKKKLGLIETFYNNSELWDINSELLNINSQ